MVYGEHLQGLCGNQIQTLNLKSLDHLNLGQCGSVISSSESVASVNAAEITQLWATKNCAWVPPTELPETKTCLNENFQICDTLHGEVFSSVRKS